MRALVAGWFSFPGMGATAGDLLARDVVVAWLAEAGVAHDVALAPPFAGGVDWRAVDPARYTHLLFVCGPVGDGWPLTDLLSRFAGRRLVGLDVSMLDAVSRWNPFHVLLERDSDRVARPDLALLAPASPVPVVARVVVHAQGEYRDRAAHAEAEALLDGLLAGCGAAIVPVDTRLDLNATGLTNPAQVEAVIARMDAVVTTRLHGLVLALRNGVPAVAVDPVRGGAKVRNQGRALGWPHVFEVTAAPADLARALADCLTPDARGRAREAADGAAAALDEVRRAVWDEFASVRA